MNIIKMFHRKWNLFLVNFVFKGTNPLFFPIKRRLLNSIGYDIGKGTKIVAPIENYAKLKIGEDCWIGKNFTINGNGEVIIGDRCDIAPEVTIFTGGHEVGKYSRRAGKGCSYKIKIENGVWIGGRATILKDITIESGSVIAAGACVVKNVKKDEIVGGNPAKVIRRLNDNI